MRPATAVLLLAAALCAAGPARAEDGAPSVAEALRAARQQTESFRQDQARRRRQTLAALTADGLDPAALDREGWRPDELADLAGAIRRASAAVARLQARYPDAVADAYHNGAMTNLNQTFYAFYRKLAGDEQGKKADYKRGCLAHQAVTLSAVLQKPMRDVEARRLMVGFGLEHHAVVLFPKGADWQKSGVVLDGWLDQESAAPDMTFPIGRWKTSFLPLRAIDGMRLED